MDRNTDRYIQEIRNALTSINHQIAEGKSELAEIKKELRALVNLQVIKIVNQKTKDGDFSLDKEDGKLQPSEPKKHINLDAMSKYHDILLNDAYEKSGKKKE